MSPKRSLQRLAAPLLALAVVLSGTARLGAQTFDLPDIGSSADTVMTGAEEQRLGRAFMRSVRSALPVIDDPLLTDYIDSLGKRLVAASGDATGRYHFFLIDEPVVNAFAGPDGHIGVYAGLLLASETENELAAVLAHEIAHVTQRHLFRAFEDQKRMSIPTTALLVAAAILGAQVDSQLGAAAIAGVQAASLQRQINFTRDNEKEADRIGIATLAAADFDPYAMAGFFERLSKAGRVYENAAPELLRTHPVTTDRIAESLERAGRFGHKQRPDDLRYHLARAALRERSYGSADKAVAHFRSSLDSKRYRSEAAERYGHALASARAGDLATARRQAAWLMDKHPNQPEVLVLDARLTTRAGNPAEAINKLRAEVGLRPGSLPLRIAYAEALMAAGKPSRALETLEDVERRQGGNALLYALMADAALKSGRKADTYRLRAEKHYAEGDIEPAIRQLEIALRQRDIAYHDAAKLQARLQVMEAEREAMEKAPWN